MSEQYYANAPYAQAQPDQAQNAQAQAGQPQYSQAQYAHDQYAHDQYAQAQYAQAQYWQQYAQPQYAQPYASMQYPQYPAPQARTAAPAPGTGLASWFNVTQPAYLKGLLLGAGVALVVTNPTVQKALIGGAVRVWAAVQGGVEEMKEQIEDVKAELSREG